MRFLALAAAVVVAATVGVAAGDAGDRKASIAVAAQAPLSIRGAGFEGRERVRVTVRARTTATRVVRASTTGAWRASFAGIVADRCSTVRIAARGGSGSTATLKLLPAPACPPPLRGDRP
jgi:hypothetical protein